MLDERLGLEGRTVIVMGAGGGGIGTAVSRIVAEAGAVVVAVDIDEARLAVAEAAVAEIGGRCVPLLGDGGKDDLVAEVVGEAVAHGPLHGLVHVAGGMYPEEWEPLLAVSVGTYENVLSRNFQSALITSRATAGWLMEQGTGGSIVHIASITANSAMPYGGIYAAAKAGMLSIMRTSALEWGHAGIRVNAIAAGTIRTAKNRAESTPTDTEADRAVIPLGRRGRPDDIAGAALFLLSDLATFVTGATLVVDGGSSVRPSFLDEDNVPVFVTDTALRERLRGT